MLNVRLICVGRLKEGFYREAAREYEKRLSALCRLEITELPECRLPQSPSPAQVDAALRKEAEAVRARIPPNSCLVALCVEGEEKSSPELAQLLSDFQLRGEKHLVLVIGSSFGLHPSLKKEAALRLSMSPMTFPHHLARVMVLEQLYRAMKINEGSSYHK